MRKTVCIVMLVLFLATVFSAIAESHVHPGRSGIHTVFAVLFIISTLVHVIINRKSFIRYLSGPVKKEG